MKIVVVSALFLLTPMTCFSKALLGKTVLGEISCTVNCVPDNGQTYTRTPVEDQEECNMFAKKKCGEGNFKASTKKVFGSSQKGSHGTLKNSRP